MVRPTIIRSKAVTKAVHLTQDRLQQAEGNKDCEMTINVCVKKFIKCSESHDAESMGNGVQRGTWDIKVSEGSRLACTPCWHLEGVNNGHLGVECHTVHGKYLEGENIGEFGEFVSIRQIFIFQMS